MPPVSRLPERLITNWELAAQIASWSPHLRAVRRANLDRHGSLEAHLFMQDVLARVAECQGAFSDTNAPERRELDAILDILERGARSGDAPARNAISVSFMGNARGEPFFDALMPLLGPSLKASLLPQDAGIA